MDEQKPGAPGNPKRPARRLVGTSRAVAGKASGERRPPRPQRAESNGMPEGIPFDIQDELEQAALNLVIPEGVGGGSGEGAPMPQSPAGPEMNISELEKKPIRELFELAKGLEIDNPSGLS
ncbi:MAG: hypothetical protein KC488_01065, partial [Candidatus Cloacimonetes bacterium]|nr:hypothetical protein [Candidatus Cloacimonadota bacterium]